MVFADDRPLKIINAFENQSSAIIKLSAYIDTYLYVVKFLDPKIVNGKFLFWNNLNFAPNLLSGSEILLKSLLDKLLSPIIFIG